MAKVNLGPNSISLMPRKGDGYVYFIKHNGAIIYIGSSTNIRKRLTSHECAVKGAVAYARFFECVHYGNYKDIEKAAINGMEPPLNNLKYKPNIDKLSLFLGMEFDKVVTFDTDGARAAALNHNTINS